MKKKPNKMELAIFENFKIRRHYDEKKELWYFSVVDVITALTNSKNPAVYWRVLKKRLIDEGSDETVTKCNGLKMMASDGKMRLTDVADTEVMLRLIQSIPSPKAEPLKIWLAKVGYERMQDMADPVRSLNRAREYWKKHGRSQKWIQQRMMGQETRNKLTDYWSEHDIKKENEYAILTNIIHEEWADISVQEHKKLKNLKTQNLRDHMSEAELIFTALAELSTRQIAETTNATGMPENIVAGKKGGTISKKARLQLEEQTGKNVITGENFLLKDKNVNKLK
jgi:DNA-damage-inducible protein D